MSVRRIVPDIRSRHLEASREFYVDVLGLEEAMDMGFIVTLVSPSNPTAQVTRSPEPPPNFNSGRDNPRESASDAAGERQRWRRAWQITWSVDEIVGPLG